MSDNRGRREGSRNKGYFYRTGRGWFTKDQSGGFVPLVGEDGQRLKDKSLKDSVVKLAHARYLTTEKTKQAAKGQVTVLEVCNAYLESIKREGGAANTLESRSDTLYDFCTGLPAMWRDKPGKKRYRDRPDRKPTDADKIPGHPGYGGMAVADLKPFHVDAWLKAHKGWSPTGQKTRLQAVKRAMNWAAKLQLIERNPIRGMSVSIPHKENKATYLDDIQEAALLKSAKGQLRIALRVLIRTGMRPGCEFAKLTAAHVVDLGDKLELRFKPTESKNRKERIVRVSDPEIVDIIRRKVADHKQGPIFRNRNSRPWIVRCLSLSFRRALARAEKAGVKFDEHVCLYSTRHTYAKRCLTGYWSGKPITIQVLAELMGNTPKICQEYYLKWTKNFDAPLWAAC
jgi:integrase